MVGRKTKPPFPRISLSLIHLILAETAPIDRSVVTSDASIGTQSLISFSFLSPFRIVLCSCFSRPKTIDRDRFDEENVLLEEYLSVQKLRFSLCLTVSGFPFLHVAFSRSMERFPGNRRGFEHFVQSRMD